MLGYTNKQITTAEMIAQLLELAKWVREAKRHGEELGLSDEETAFYDALAENGSAKEVMKSDTLRLMARELAEMVKRMPKLDWTQRESVRATFAGTCAAAGEVRLSAGPVGGRDAARAEAGGAVDGKRRRMVDGCASGREHGRGGGCRRHPQVGLTRSFSMEGAADEAENERKPEGHDNS